MTETPVPCAHCGGERTTPHCDNPQCTWVGCVDPKCRKITAVPKAGV